MQNRAKLSLKMLYLSMFQLPTEAARRNPPPPINPQQKTEPLETYVFTRCEQRSAKLAEDRDARSTLLAGLQLRRTGNGTAALAKGKGREASRQVGAFIAVQGS